jgi:hypothetical protein
MMRAKKDRWRLVWLIVLALLVVESAAFLVAIYQKQDALRARPPTPLALRQQSRNETIAESIAPSGVEPDHSAVDGPAAQVGPATETPSTSADDLLPTPTPTPGLVIEGAWTSSNAGRPIWLTVPALGISTAIEEVGMNQDGSMATPSDWSKAGWFALGYLPGQAGTAVIAGHLDAPGGKKAVFWDLHLLRPDDEIRIEMNNGRMHLYQVERSASYPYDGAPLDEIFSWSAESRLALITCRGDWDRAEHTYADRLVVFARYSGELKSRPDASAGGGTIGDVPRSESYRPNS